MEIKSPKGAAGTPGASSAPGAPYPHNKETLKKFVDGVVEAGKMLGAEEIVLHFENIVGESIYVEIDDFYEEGLADEVYEKLLGNLPTVH